YEPRTGPGRAVPSPRATPLNLYGRDTDRKGCQIDYVYALGATGRLTCLDSATSRLVWSADILKDNANLPAGMAASPVDFSNAANGWAESDDGDCREVEKSWREIIVVPGVQSRAAKGRAIIAYDATTGKELRAFGNHRGGCSTPIITTLNNRKQLIVFDGDG